MQFNLTTDYAIRIVAYLATVKQATATELSQQLGISKPYITRMMQSSGLTDIYIESISGFNGGYRLKCSSKEITLLDIIKQMEKSLLINCCLENDEMCNNCTLLKKETCPIKRVYTEIQMKLERKLDNITIYDIAMDNI